MRVHECGPRRGLYLWSECGHRAGRTDESISVRPLGPLTCADSRVGGEGKCGAPEAVPRTAFERCPEGRQQA
eukprot:3213272-Alexandrium_andersonii.AAC.1